MNVDDTYEFEDNYYVQPTVSRDEQLSFVDNLRDIQSQKNQEIKDQTYAMGTQVPTNLGGLTAGTGENGYFATRYQNPQVNSQVASLRATAQQSALNQLLKNEAAAYGSRYNDAYRNYQKRAYNKSYNNNTPTTTDPYSDDGWKPNININVEDEGTPEDTKLLRYVGPTGNNGAIEVFVGSDGRQFVKDLYNELNGIGIPAVVPSGGRYISVDDLLNEGWSFYNSDL